MGSARRPGRKRGTEEVTLGMMRDALAIFSARSLFSLRLRKDADWATVASNTRALPSSWLTGLADGRNRRAAWASA